MRIRIDIGDLEGHAHPDLFLRLLMEIAEGVAGETEGRAAGVLVWRRSRMRPAVKAIRRLLGLEEAWVARSSLEGHDRMDVAVRVGLGLVSASLGRARDTVESVPGPTPAATKLELLELNLPDFKQALREDLARSRHAGGTVVLAGVDRLGAAERAATLDFLRRLLRGTGLRLAVTESG